MGFSYKRAIFLLALQQRGTVTQHELAVALGYSDPAVSTMLLVLAHEGYVQTTPSPDHGRKRLVTITPKGSDVVAASRQLLDERLDVLLMAAGVDAQHVGGLIDRVSSALGAKIEEELA
jgi:DNA-binding MarR family transcriptional regulator